MRKKWWFLILVGRYINLFLSLNSPFSHLKKQVFKVPTFKLLLHSCSSSTTFFLRLYFSLSLFLSFFLSLSLFLSFSTHFWDSLIIKKNKGFAFHFKVNKGIKIVEMTRRIFFFFFAFLVMQCLCFIFSAISFPFLFFSFSFDALYFCSVVSLFEWLRNNFFS